MSAHAVGRLHNAARSAAGVAQARAPPTRSYAKTNFNAYVAQRAKQPFVPRGTAVIPRKTQPPATSYERAPIIPEGIRRMENRMQLSKFQRAPLEMFGDVKITSEFRLPGDELMPEARIRRVDATPLGHEMLDEGENDETPDIDFETNDEETIAETISAKLFEDEEEEDGEGAKKADLDPDLDPDEQEALAQLKEEEEEEVVDEAAMQRRRVLAGLSAKPSLEEQLEEAAAGDDDMEEMDDKKVAARVDETYARLMAEPDTEEHADEQGDLDDEMEETDYNDQEAPLPADIAEEVNSMLTPEEIADDKPWPVGRDDEPMHPKEAERQIVNMFIANQREPMFRSLLQEEEAKQLVRNPLEEAALGDPTAVRDVVRAGYDDFEEVPVESIEEEVIREEDEEEQMVQATQDNKVPMPDSMLDAVHVLNVRRSLGMPELPGLASLAEEDLKLYKDGVKLEGDNGEDLEELHNEDDGDENAEGGAATKAAAKQGDERPRQDTMLREQDEEDEIDPELEATSPQADDMFADVETEGVRATEDDEDAGEFGPAVRVNLADPEFEPPAGLPDADDPEVEVRGDEIPRVVEAYTKAAALQFQSDTLAADLAKLAARSDEQMIEEKQRNRAIFAANSKALARDAEFLNRGPLAGTYEAAKAADDRLRQRELEMRLQVKDLEGIAQAAITNATMTEEEIEAEQQKAALELDPENELDMDHERILEDLGRQHIDYSNHEEFAEARFENAILSGDIARAAATVPDLQEDEMSQADIEEETEERLEKLEKTMTPAEVKRGQREYLLTLESMQAILEPGSVPQDNPVARYMKYGDKPGYEDLGQELKAWAMEKDDPELSTLYDEEEEAFKQKREDRLHSVLRSLVARGHLPMNDAKAMARDPIDYIFSFSSPRKTEMLRERYLTFDTSPNKGNGKTAETRREYSEYTLSQMQDMLREALMALQNSLLSYEVRRLGARLRCLLLVQEKKKIAAGLASDMGDVDAALLAAKRGAFSDANEIRAVSVRLNLSVCLRCVPMYSLRV